MSGGNPLEPLLASYRTVQGHSQPERSRSPPYDSAIGQVSKIQQGQGKATTLICENELVLKELDLLEDDAQVFKLIGPVLVKQELVEVKSNVSKRIEYIKSDITRLEGQLKSKMQEQEEIRQKISKLQKGE